MSQKAVSSSVKSSRNAKTPGKRRSHYSKEQHNDPTRMYDGLRIRREPSDYQANSRRKNQGGNKSRIFGANNNDCLGNARATYQRLVDKAFHKQIGKNLEQKKQKVNEDLSQERLQQMMVIILEQGIHVEALQTKYPIINWEIYTKGTRQYWKIIRVGNITEVHQFFVDMIKAFDKEDLEKL
nr:hypothetical protein [Tanacetum cinerariifolium]